MPRRRHLPLIVALAFTLAACGAPADNPARGGAAAAPRPEGTGTRSAVPFAPAAAPATPTSTPAPTAVPTATPAGTPTATREVVALNPPASCPVTLPPDPPFTPPSGARPYAGEFWYGTEALWTRLRADGTWQMAHRDGAYFDKSFWWRRGYDWRAEPEPALTVTGRRLDAPAPPLAASRATNGFHGDLGSFMLVGVGLPAPGCWEITGRIAGTELSFVVWVGP